MSAPTQYRILVAVDPATARLEVLRTLSILGGGPAGEVLGLLVEDAALLQVARLPGVREITLEAALVRPLSLPLLERQLRDRADRVRARFEAAVGPLAPRHGFRVARGEWVTELVKAAQGFDVLILTHARSAIGPHRGLRARLRELLVAGPRTLVFVQEEWPTGRRVAVLYDGSGAAAAALKLAAELAESEGLGLSVLVPGTDEEQAAALAEQARASSRATRVLRLPDTSVDELSAAVWREDARVLVLPAQEAEADSTLLASLLERASCSLITTH